MKYSNKNNYETSEMECKKCGERMYEVSHKVIDQKRLQRPFYYFRWYVCPECGWRINFETDKVFKVLHQK